MIHYLQDIQIERQFARLPSVQATANSTKALTVADAPLQIFTGTVAGQIVQMPDATTLIPGVMCEISNQSTVPIRINDFGGNLLLWLSQSRRARLIVQDGSTQNGTWTIDANQYGANSFYQEAAGPITNNSNTTWVNAVSLVTDNLPLGDYQIMFQSLFSASANNRAPQYRITANAALIGNIYSVRGGPTGGANGYYNFSGIKKVSGTLSGIQTVNLEFRNNGNLGNATITVIENVLRIMRV